MTTQYTYAIVLDFEATCDDRNPPDPQEIIEFPSVLVSLHEHQVVDEFEAFVRPVHHPVLTPFCTQLTSINTQDLADAPAFPQVFEEHQAWLTAHGLDESNAIIVTCGDWDLATMLPAQCLAAEPPIMSLPLLYSRWHNVKEAYKAVTGRSKAPGMPGMLRELGLRLTGYHHRGIDDCRNIAELLLMLHRSGAAVDVTDKLRTHRYPGLSVRPPNMAG